MNINWLRLRGRALKDRSNTSLNKNGWATRHYNALVVPDVATEMPLCSMLRGWADWADEHRTRYESPIGHDQVIGIEWLRIGCALRGLLNAEVGRIDCGSVDGWLLDTAQREGVNLETEEIGQDVEGVTP